MFTPARLKLARQRRQLTAAALARALDVGPRSVSDFEHGRRTPAEAELTELARVLGFPVEFFAAGEPAELAEDVVSFRARAKLPARRRTAALAAGRLAIEFNAFLERRFTLPEVDVPTVDSTPSAAVDAVREQWQLGSKPAPNLVHLLEAHGVRVFSLGVDHTDVDAFSFWHEGTPFVFLNTANYTDAFQWFPFPRYLGNTLTICVICVLSAAHFCDFPYHFCWKSYLDTLSVQTVL